MLASELVELIQKEIDAQGDHRITVWEYYNKDISKIYFDYDSICVDGKLVTEPILVIDVE